MLRNPFCGVALTSVTIVPDGMTAMTAKRRARALAEVDVRGRAHLRARGEGLVDGADVHAVVGRDERAVRLAVVARVPFRSRVRRDLGAVGRRASAAAAGSAVDAQALTRTGTTAIVRATNISESTRAGSDRIDGPSSKRRAACANPCAHRTSATGEQRGRKLSQRDCRRFVPSGITCDMSLAAPREGFATSLATARATVR